MTAHLGSANLHSVLTWALAALVAVISLVSVAVCIADKLRSKKKGASRVSEATLMTLSAFGGALFMFLTMLVIRHKTRHSRFMICLPLMIIFHALIAYLIFS